MRNDTLRALEQSGPFPDATEANRAFDSVLGVDIPELRAGWAGAWGVFALDIGTGRQLPHRRDERVALLPSISRL